MQALVYARVSTNDKGQRPEIQVAEVEAYCLARGWAQAKVVIDHGYSGGNDQRPGLKRVLALARSRQIDVVVVTKLDRMARSLRHLVTLLDEFSTLGVSFVSLRDQIDLSTASGRLMLHIIGAFAEFERSLVRERTLAGLAYARSRGKTLGRPINTDYEAIRNCLAAGLSHAEIRNQLGVSKGAIWRSTRGAPKSPLKCSTKISMKSGAKNG